MHISGRELDEPWNRYVPIIVLCLLSTETKFCNTSMILTITTCELSSRQYTLQCSRAAFLTVSIESAMRSRLGNLPGALCEMEGVRRAESKPTSSAFLTSAF